MRPIGRMVDEAVLDYRLPSPPISREAMNELHRIGGNINQIARHANATGELRADLDAALEEVIRAMDRLLDVSHPMTRPPCAKSRRAELAQSARGRRRKMLHLDLLGSLLGVPQIILQLQL
jgi:hypothetical protein